MAAEQAPDDRQNALRNHARVAAAGLAALAGIGADSPVMTPAGPVAAGRLRAGDRVVTYDAGTQRIAQVSARDVPLSSLLRIAPAVLDPKSTAPDLVVAAGQPLLIRDWRARAMFGRRAVLVAAARLADGAYIAPVQGHGTRPQDILRYDTARQGAARNGTASFGIVPSGTARLVTLGFSGAARILQLGGGIEVQGVAVATPARAFPALSLPSLSPPTP